MLIPGQYCLEKKPAEAQPAQYDRLGQSVKTKVRHKLFEYWQNTKEMIPHIWHIIQTYPSNTTLIISLQMTASTPIARPSLWTHHKSMNIIRKKFASIPHPVAGKSLKPCITYSLHHRVIHEKMWKISKRRGRIWHKNTSFGLLCYTALYFVKKNWWAQS